MEQLQRRILNLCAPGLRLAAVLLTPCLLLALGNACYPWVSIEQYDAAKSDCAWYPDVDGDGHGDPEAEPVISCDGPGDGYADNSDDCDDEDPNSLPGAEEICDDKDNNCDDIVDEGFTELVVYYPDEDGDGHGSPSGATAPRCGPPAEGGWVELDTDCDDTDPQIHAYQTERCNGIDDDCRSGIDNAEDGFWFWDGDRDGHGDPQTTTLGCSDDGEVEYWVEHYADDCDDTNASVHPGAPEVCNGVDDDCADGIDNDDEDAGWHLDADGDGFGEAAVSSDTCVGGSGLTSNGDDCDDTSASIHPGGTEILNQIDDNCDGFVDEGFDDNVCEGNFYVEGTTATLDDLLGCTSITGDLGIMFSQVEDLDELSDLQYVGGTVWIESNDSLTSFDGLSSLTGVGGNLSLTFNPLCADLGGLSSLRVVGGDLYIMAQQQLTTLDGLSSLETVGGILSLSDNANLTNIDAMSGLAPLGGLSVSMNSQLASLEGLGGVRGLSGPLILIYNDALTNLDGLEGIDSANFVEITDNPVLSDVSGLSDLTEVNEYFILRDNLSLCQDDALALASTIIVGDSATVQDNDGACP